MARKSKLTEDRKNKIVSLIKAGNYSSQAALAAGVSESTFYRWLSRGEAAAKICEEWDLSVDLWNDLSDKEKIKNQNLKPNNLNKPDYEEILYWEFWEDIKKSEAEAEASAVLHIKKAASEGTWQAAAWYLERKFKDRWSKNDKITHEGNVDHSHNLSLKASEQEIKNAKTKLIEARKLKSVNNLADLSDLTKEPDLIEAEIIEDD